MTTSEDIAGIRVTHPDRVVYEDQGLTKRDLAEYYDEVAEHMLPHVADRPLSLVRCPKGQTQKCFYQKHVGESFPEAVGRVEIEEKQGDQEIYATVRSAAGLVGLVQMGVLELHLWSCRKDRLERPDRMVFDLDPDEGLEWKRVVEAARAVHDALEELELRSFVKTSGGKGLHVVVPLDRRHSWDEVLEVSRALAQKLADETPERYTADMRKEKRQGRVLVDYLRNSRGSTWVAPFSTRARPGAPVSTPVAWDELEGDLRSDTYTVANLRRRLASLEADPWKRIDDVRQSLTREIRRALSLDGA